MFEVGWMLCRKLLWICEVMWHKWSKADSVDVRSPYPVWCFQNMERIIFGLAKFWKEEYATRFAWTLEAVFLSNYQAAKLKKSFIFYALIFLLCVVTHSCSQSGRMKSHGHFDGKQHIIPAPRYTFWTFWILHRRSTQLDIYFFSLGYVESAFRILQF